jgi:transposase-like protein
VDSSGATIDFLLSCRRNAAAAKRFLQKALQGHPRPRVINVDGNPSYPKVIAELKKTGEWGRRCHCRPVRYLNNIVEQDHRAIKTTRAGKSGLPIVSGSGENDPGLGDGEHDPQGANEVASQG